MSNQFLTSVGQLISSSIGLVQNPYFSFNIFARGTISQYTQLILFPILILNRLIIILSFLIWSSECNFLTENEHEAENSSIQNYKFLTFTADLNSAIQNAQFQASSMQNRSTKNFLNNVNEFNLVYGDDVKISVNKSGNASLRDSSAPKSKLFQETSNSYNVSQELENINDLKLLFLAIRWVIFVSNGNYIQSNEDKFIVSM
ncbi:Hypothetical_protein [Hexamita inflata]|uniref:Hypothetical_protein n=1 Tax=Hexamita inflata TaxID=28002 RepID=A0AA86U1W9_9EUKA|nr:Hypothetical protein HINF_LOCUS26550 [Hexamita inflata]